MSERRGRGRGRPPSAAEVERLVRWAVGPRGRDSNADRLLRLLVVALVLLAAFWLSSRVATRRPATGPLPPSSGTGEGYSFCTWNAENLFDDEDDPQNRDDDEDWFGAHPEAVRLKVSRLAEALLTQNGGHGPDVLALVEVENRRAVELLQDALNDRLEEPWRYTGLIHRDNRTGRRIEPALLSRLPVRDDLTRTFGIRRILEAHLEAAGAPLVVLVSHWTSRLRDGGVDKRFAYADALYAIYLDLRDADPAVDLLLCGDYNDEPGDPSLLDHLHAEWDPTQVVPDADPPRLYELLGGRDPNDWGTYFYRGRWQILDHLLAAPGLLDDQGWTVLPGTLRVENDDALRTQAGGPPFRFGGPRDEGKPRGFSDHFAVTVRLRLDPERVVE